MKLALYSTIYPGVEPFLNGWVASVKNQTDADIDIFIGVDGFTPEDIRGLLGNVLPATFLYAEPSSTPVGLRRACLEKFISDYDGIVFVDSDDILEASRVAFARAYLSMYDVVGSTMSLVNSNGDDLGIYFGRRLSGFNDADVLLHNIFGLSNTAYRTAVIKDCLDFPQSCELLDWYFITKAWCLDAAIYFDAVSRMKYRRYNDNSVNLCPPFSIKTLINSSRRVLNHLNDFLSTKGLYNQKKINRLVDRKREVELFLSFLLSDAEFRKKYLEKINEPSKELYWWSYVANKKVMLQCK